MKNDFITVPYSKQLLNEKSSCFDCGNSFLTHFLKNDISLDYSHGKTCIYLSPDNTHIIGYYNISMAYLEDISSAKSYKMGGAAHIECFALDKRYQGLNFSKDKRFSDLLLLDCILRIENIRENHIGCSFITLASTKEGYSLYARNGFEHLESSINFSVSDVEKDCIRMYLPLDYE